VRTSFSKYGQRTYEKGYKKSLLGRKVVTDDMPVILGLRTFDFTQSPRQCLYLPGLLLNPFAGKSYTSSAKKLFVKPLVGDFRQVLRGESL